MFGADAWNFRWINNRSQYTFNWHDVSLLTIAIILLVFAFVLFQQIRRRRYLGAVIFSIPSVLFVLWMVSDIASYNEADPNMHGMLNWQNVPEYFVATVLIGFLLFTASRLWEGKSKSALYAGIPSALLLIWYATNGADSLPNVATEEQYGFNIALGGVIIAAVWQMSGYTMAMYLAGIRGIPEELREAARVDGCNEIQVYTKIILPLLRPISLSAAIVLGHISLKIFDLIFADGWHRSLADKCSRCSGVLHHVPEQQVCCW